MPGGEPTARVRSPSWPKAVPAIRPAGAAPAARSHVAWGFCADARNASRPHTVYRVLSGIFDVRLPARGQTAARHPRRPTWPHTGAWGPVAGFRFGPFGRGQTSPSAVVVRPGRTLVHGVVSGVFDLRLSAGGRHRAASAPSDLAAHWCMGSCRGFSICASRPAADTARHPRRPTWPHTGAWGPVGGFRFAPLGRRETPRGIRAARAGCILVHGVLSGFSICASRPGADAARHLRLGVPRAAQSRLPPVVWVTTRPAGSRPGGGVGSRCRTTASGELRGWSRGGAHLLFRCS
jgi:hypothetical protein